MLGFVCMACLEKACAYAHKPHLSICGFSQIKKYMRIYCNAYGHICIMRNRMPTSIPNPYNYQYKEYHQQWRQHRAKNCLLHVCSALTMAYVPTYIPKTLQQQHMMALRALWKQNRWDGCVDRSYPCYGYDYYKSLHHKMRKNFNTKQAVEVSKSAFVS